MMHWIMRLGLSFHLLLPSAPGDGDKQLASACNSLAVAPKQHSLMALQRRALSLGPCSKHGKGAEASDDERKNSLPGTLLGQAALSLEQQEQPKESQGQEPCAGERVWHRGAACMDT